LGEGDALIAGLIGAWLSWDGLIGSVAIGAPLGIVWALLRRDLRAPLPLVPALSAGVVIFLCSGSKPW
jgi:prepilin signal peptidase PulO-like enzyme (type II secretory pathway)